ncbi:MAG: hypothetical protein R6V07_18905 [Armatimonadota bacterium]
MPVALQWLTVLIPTGEDLGGVGPAHERLAHGLGQVDCVGELGEHRSGQREAGDGGSAPGGHPPGPRTRFERVCGADILQRSAAGRSAPALSAQVRGLRVQRGEQVLGEGRLGLAALGLRERDLLRRLVLLLALLCQLDLQRFSQRRLAPVGVLLGGLGGHDLNQFTIYSGCIAKHARMREALGQVNGVSRRRPPPDGFETLSLPLLHIAERVSE